MIFSKIVMTIQYSENLPAQIVKLERRFRRNASYSESWRGQRDCWPNHCCKNRFNAENKRAAQLQLLTLFFRARNRQFPHEGRHRRASTLSRRAGVSHKVAGSRAADCPCQSESAR